MTPLSVTLVAWIRVHRAFIVESSIRNDNLLSPRAEFSKTHYFAAWCGYVPVCFPNLAIPVEPSESKDSTSAKNH